jgi:peptide/nickel transport system ATP-binding protein/oligopeptide transport system ATP-binding protein
MSARERRGIVGKDVAMIFQEPLSSLNPCFTVGFQIGEALKVHLDLSRSERRERSLALLQAVGITDAERRLRAFPHQLSGGMNQRVMIAMALACRPKLLIADEPTTALDVTIQAQILREITELRDETGAGVIMVTHDLGVVADMADRVVVMYAGRVVEEGTLDDLFYDPQHPYTWGLLGSITRMDRERPRRLPAIPGMPPSLVNRPEGCPFRPRCPHEFSKCVELPPLENRVPESAGHRDRCWLEVAEKRERRLVDGQIGLTAEGTVTA